MQGEYNFYQAVEHVIDSYDSADEMNQILVQPMLQEIALSGVAFTVEPSTMGHYYVINYDDVTGSTSSVTSGMGRENKLFYCFKDQSDRIDDDSMKKICACLKELEMLFGQAYLDVEFAMDHDGQLYILQVRPLCGTKFGINREEQVLALKGIADKLQKENTKKPFLYGSRTIYGVMPDWNPAEIIGIRPKPLALSLYKEIITDNIWAYQRDNYGYRNLRSFPLLIDFAGLPYIDVRVSFNSFLPANLRPELGEKLVEFYLSKLEKNPSLHDKIEFEIAFTCYTLDLKDRIMELEQNGFTEAEIQEIVDALREMTKKIIDNEVGLWKKDYKKIEHLVQRHQEVMESDFDIISKIYWLLEDCKRYGTLPFAGLARAGFIAVQLLRSLVNIGILSQSEYQQFMSDLNTVSSMMKRDKHQMSKPAFLQKYGHLRPGTYDICSKRYDEASEIYFDWDKEECFETQKAEEFRLSLDQMNRLQSLLREHGLSDDILGFFHFIRTVIEGREFAKFIFTRSLSDVMKLFGELGSKCGLTQEDCAYADCAVIKELYASSQNQISMINHSVQRGKEKYTLTSSLTLPPLLIQPMDAYIFWYPDTAPNYITLNEVVGQVCYLESGQTEYQIDDKIVMIPSADPGFDWIFSHKIKGFITKYGGANSHMAIRAGELSIPAVIGAGEKLFEHWRRASVLQIDAGLKRVSVLK